MRPSRRRQIDTTRKVARKSFSAAGVKLSNIDQIPMIVRHEQWPEPVDMIYVFGRDPQSMRDGAQVFIEVYSLPGAEKEMRRNMAMYRKRKGAFMVGGKKLDPTLLVPATVPTEWGRDIFQTRDGAYRRRIVYVFTAPDRAVILVYSLNCAKFDSSKFFKRVSENLSFD